jgi:hypothetical protein
VTVEGATNPGVVEEQVSLFFTSLFFHLEVYFKLIFVAMSFQGCGGAFGGLVGASVCAFQLPSTLERAMIIGGEQAKAQLPRATRLMGANAALFGTIGAVYSGGKCVAEGLTGLGDHPINSGYIFFCRPRILTNIMPFSLD